VVRHQTRAHRTGRAAMARLTTFSVVETQDRANRVSCGHGAGGGRQDWNRLHLAHQTRVDGTRQLHPKQRTAIPRTGLGSPRAQAGDQPRRRPAGRPRRVRWADRLARKEKAASSGTDAEKVTGRGAADAARAATLRIASVASMPGGRIENTLDSSAQPRGGFGLVVPNWLQDRPCYSGLRRRLNESRT
jgi:hypothetical protein